MARQSKLTPEQWAIAKARWEGSDKPGFAWLAYEIEDAWGMPILRKTLDMAAKARGWEKGGPPSDTIPRGNFPKDDASGKRKLPAPSDTPRTAKKTKGINGKAAPKASARTTHEVADEVVDSPSATTPAERRKVGRPTKYSDTFPELIVEWFDKEPYTEKVIELPNGSTKVQMVATNVPMLVQFAKSIGTDLRTVNRWATELAEEGKFRYPDFAEAYARAREMQEAMVAQGAMIGVYESRAAAFFLKNKHGWQDQPAQKVAVAAISRDELDSIYGKAMELSRQRKQEILERKLKMLESQDGSR